MLLVLNFEFGAINKDLNFLRFGKDVLLIIKLLLFIILFYLN